MALQILDSQPGDRRKLLPLAGGKWILGIIIALSIFLAAAWFFYPLLRSQTGAPTSIAGAGSVVETATLPAGQPGEVEATIDPFPGQSLTITRVVTVSPTVTPLAIAPKPATPTPFPSPTPSPSPPPPPSVIVGTAGLNMRTGPSLSYAELESLPTLDSRLEIVGQNADTSWWQICCLGGETGWVLAEEATIDGDVRAVPVVDPPMPQARVLVNALNLRSGPGLSFPVLSLALLNEEFTVVSRLENSTWWQICCVNEEVAWVFGGSIAILDSAEFVPVSTGEETSAAP